MRFLLGVLILVVSCSPANESPPPELRGVAVDPPGPKPEFTLTDTDGEPFDFRERTDGTLTLLFFGYTNCPDVCPLHMSNIAAVLHKLPIRDARRVSVVFVTTDPDRDTPERLRSWLNDFDPRFTGLTGSPEELQAAQAAAGVPAAVVTPSSSHADYAVGHAGQVLAYTPDNRFRAAYPFGTRQEDWAHDIPRLLSIGPGETP
ncbi:MAG: SCO family protein [Gemmatimonadales bacterium]